MVKEKNDLASKYVVDKSILDAFNDFLTSPGTDDAFTSILKDYLPRKEVLRDDKGNITKVIEKPATGLSFSTFFKVVGLFFTKPRSTYNLLRFAQDQEKYNNLEFRKALIEGDSVWSFIQNTAAQNLDKIGEMMQGLGFTIFENKGILDQDGLKSIQSSLTSSDVIKDIKSIASQSLSSNPNQIKIAASALKLVDKSPGFRNYFYTKGGSIKDFISDQIKSSEKSELEDLQTWNKLDEAGKRKFLADKSYKKSDIDQIITSNELPKGVARSITSFGITTDDLDQILEIIPIILKKTGELGDIVQKIDDNQLVQKGEEIIGLAQNIRRNPIALAQILEKLSEGDYIGVAEDALYLVDQTPEMQKYFNDSKDAFAKIIETSMNQNEAFKSSGLSGDVINILPYLLNHPKELVDIINLQKKGEFLDLGEKVLSLINNDNNIKDYFAKNTDGIKKFAMQMIKAEIADQKRELSEGGLAEENRLAVALKYYGMKKTDLDSLSEILPILLKNTKDIQKIITQVKEGKYQEIAMVGIDMVGPGQEINGYITKNKDIFGKLLENSLKDMPLFSDIKANVVDILPIMLNDPESLKVLVKQGLDNQFMIMPETFLNMMEKNNDLREFFEKNVDVMQSLGIKFMGMEAYNIPKDLSEAMLHLTTPDNIRQMKKLAPLAAEGKWDDLGIGLISMMESNKKFTEEIKNKKDDFAKLINAVIDKTPQAKQYLGEAKIGKLSVEIFNNLSDIKSVLEASKKGSIATVQAGAKLATKLLMNQEVRSQLIKAATKWWKGSSADKQAVVTSISAALKNRESPDEKKKLSLSNFINDSFQDVTADIQDEKVKAKLLDKAETKTLFNNISIEGTPEEYVNFSNLDIKDMSFIDSKLKNVSFKNTDLINVSFAGAKLDNVKFAGATMDWNTLVSLKPEILERKIDLNGVKLIGNFSQLDLSGISFSGADLSAVTSLDSTTMTHTNFYKATIPETKIFEKVFGLDEIIFHTNIPDEVKQANAKFVSDYLVNSIAFKAANSENKVMSEESKKNLGNFIQEIYDNPSTILGSKLRHFTARNTIDMTNTNFPEDTSKYQHLSDYKGKFSHFLSDIYKYRDNPEKIGYALVSDVIATEVSKGLFGDGQNRGQDTLKIKDSISKAVESYSVENKTSPKNLLNADNYDQMIKDIVDEIHPRTVYTAAGNVTGGIQLGTNTINNEVISRFAGIFNIYQGPNKITEKETAVIKNISEEVANNVFGQNAVQNMPKEFKIITNTLKRGICEIKSEEKGLELDKILDTKKTEIVGNYQKSGLSKYYYDNTRYFRRGFDANISSNESVTKVAQVVKSAISKEIKAAADNNINKSTGRSL